MLWQKGLLETRFRLLFVLCLSAFALAVQSSARKPGPGPEALSKPPVLGAITIQVELLAVVACGMLAGAGIYTQPSLQATNSLHGSTQYTVSLPVSRLRLLTVRAATGWLEATAATALMCFGVWRINPALRATTAIQMLEYAATVVLCASVIYGLSVFLATFLDDQWRVWGTLLGFFGWMLLSSRIHLPASMDIAQAVGKGSPLITHTMPWPTIAFSVAVAAAFFLAALKVAQAREY